MNFETPEPIIVPTRYGKFLARAPRDAALKIAVLETTEENAKSAFYRAYLRWKEDFIPPIEYHI